MRYRVAAAKFTGADRRSADATSGSDASAVTGAAGINTAHSTSASSIEADLEPFTHGSSASEGKA